MSTFLLKREARLFSICFATLVKGFAERKGLSFKDLSMLTGFAPSRVTRKLSGYSKITIRDIELFAKALEMSFEEFSQLICSQVAQERALYEKMLEVMEALRVEEEKLLRMRREAIEVATAMRQKKEAEALPLSSKAKEG